MWEKENVKVGLVILYDDCSHEVLIVLVVVVFVFFVVVVGLLEHQALFPT
jgi:hypothetical protein